MPNRTPRPHRVVGYLRWPIDYPGCIIYAEGVLTSMAKEVALFSAPVPTLVALGAALDSFRKAETLALTRAHGAAQARDDEWIVLEGLYEQELSYVQVLADAAGLEAATIFAKAGMSTRLVGHHAPHGNKMDQLVSGTVIGHAPPTGHNTAHIWECGATPATMTTTLYSIHPKIFIPDQMPGSTLCLRFRVLTVAGLGDWSQPISHIVW